MSGGGQPQSGVGQAPGTGEGQYMMNVGGNPVTATAGAGVGAPTAQQSPQWLKGMQLGTQIAQQGMGMAQQGQPKPMAPMQPRPMMGGGMQPPQGMPTGAVPGAGGMAPPMSGGGMGMGTNMGQGQPMGAQGGINPQLLQMLMRSRAQ